jgi:hypothetical protein
MSISVIDTVTERFNGHIMIDFLINDLGLTVLNPYLDKGGWTSRMATTWRRSQGEASLSPTLRAPWPSSCSTWFKDLMSANAKSPGEIREKLAHSLVMVGEIGGNDYNYSFAPNKPAASATCTTSGAW